MQQMMQSRSDQLLFRGLRIVRVEHQPISQGRRAHFRMRVAELLPLDVKNTSVQFEGLVFETIMRFRAEKLLN